MTPFLGLQQHDQRLRDQRTLEDETPLPPGIDPAQNAYFKTFNRGQQDAATGPAGFNRQWVPLLDSLDGARLNPAGSGLPTETFTDPTHSGLATNPLIALRKLKI